MIVPIPWIGMREPSAKTTVLKCEARVKENIISRFPIMWSVALESIIQIWGIDDVRQNIELPVWARVTEEEEDEACVLCSCVLCCCWNIWNCSNWCRSCSSFEIVAEVCTSRWFPFQKKALLLCMAWLFTVVAINHRLISLSSLRTSSSASGITAVTKASTSVASSSFYANTASFMSTNSLYSPCC